MPTDGVKKSKITEYIIGVVVVVLILIGVSVRYWPKKSPSVEPSLGRQLFEKIQNPAQHIPEINPFKVQSDPFATAETNPLKQIIKNPF